MVYHVKPRAHSRLRYFFRAFRVWVLLLFLINLALELLLDAPRRDSWLELACLLLVASAILSWLSLRAWVRVGWFTGEPRECFLTVVEEGLLVESPHKGLSMYLPWAGMSWRCRGGMLQLMLHGALRCLVSVEGLPKAQRTAILSSLREHAGQGAGLFAPQKAAAPFDAVLGEAGAGDKPAALLPPPAQEGEVVPALFTNTPQQWRRWAAFALRPDALLSLFYLLCIALLSFAAGITAWEEEGGLAASFCLLVALFMVWKLARPGNSYLRSAPGPIHIGLTEAEILERWEDGSWARFRMPEAGAATLVRLRDLWCLQRHGEVGHFLFDVEEDLPQPLKRYPRKAAPGNALRAFGGVVLVCLCWGLGYIADSLLTPASEAELAFRALPKPPGAAELYHYVAEYQSTAPLYGKPVLMEIPRQDGEGLACYLLSFTEAEDEEESPHYARLTHVLFLPDGSEYDVESCPPRWCPCEECFQMRLELMAEE